MTHAAAGGAMESFFLACGVALLLFMFMPLYRVVRGPSVLDRILGVNVIGAKTTVLIVLIGTLYRRAEMFVDIALAYALLNFIASLAAARLFQRHGQVDMGDDGGGGTC